MKYCKHCLQPDTRPGIKFDEEGICGACLYENEKKYIDWEKRELELQEIANWAKSIAEGSYDCVIGISGGKDSTFQAITTKERLGLNALLVNSVPDNITEVGRHNIENLIQKGFDIIHIRPNPRVMSHLTRQSFYTIGNLANPLEVALWASTYIIADKFDIPLIIQGENPALTLGVSQGMGIDGDAFNTIQQNTIKEAHLTDWLGNGTDQRALYLYKFPDLNRMQEKGIRAIWLQYYVKEWSQVGNADFSIARGLWGRSRESLYDIGRYRRYSQLDADITIVNQMIKYYKFGFGFATDEACYDIREGRLSREDAKWYVNEYDGKCADKYIEECCQYLEITVKEFWEVVDKFVNKKLFYKDPVTNKWKPKFIVGEDFEEME